MAKVYISVVSEDDDEIAVRLAEYLEGDGHETSLSITYCIGGRGFIELVKEKIDWSDAVVLVLSRTSIETRSQRAQAEYAPQRGKRVLPLLLDLQFHELSTEWKFIVGNSGPIEIAHDRAADAAVRIAAALS